MRHAANGKATYDVRALAIELCFCSSRSPPSSSQIQPAQFGRKQGGDEQYQHHPAMAHDNSGVMFLDVPDPNAPIVVPTHILLCQVSYKIRCAARTYPASTDCMVVTDRYPREHSTAPSRPRA